MQPDKSDISSVPICSNCKRHTTTSVTTRAGNIYCPNCYREMKDIIDSISEKLKIRKTL